MHEGRHDGRVDGIQYFKCANETQKNNGLFIQISRIKEIKSKVAERKAWSLKKMPKALTNNDQYVPSKMSEDAMKKIGQKLLSTCIRLSKVNNQALYLLPWLDINNRDKNNYSKMTIAEAKKAFRQKGVTRRLISDVDMDDLGDHILIGFPYDETNGTNTGTVRVYQEP